MRNEVARFSRDLVKLMTEVIAEHFSIDTIKQLSGYELLDKEAKIIALAKMQNGETLDERTASLALLPAWEEIEAVIRSEGARCFRIDIETDSTIKADQEEEKQSRIEFLTAAGTFIQQATQVEVPELQPLLMAMLRFGVGGFKAGRELEDEFSAAFEALKNRPAEPATEEEKPDPTIEIKMAEIKSKGEIETQKLKGEIAQSQAELQLQKDKLQLEIQKWQSEVAAKTRELDIKELDVKLDHDVKLVKVAEDTNLKREQMTVDVVKSAQGGQSDNLDS